MSYALELRLTGIYRGVKPHLWLLNRTIGNPEDMSSGLSMISPSLLQVMLYGKVRERSNFTTKLFGSLTAMIT